jgi:hypothetical protein
MVVFWFRFSSIGSQSFGDEADQEDNDVDDEDEVAAARERDDRDQGKHLDICWFFCHLSYAAEKMQVIQKYCLKVLEEGIV